jgi:hypothetical protein
MATLKKLINASLRKCGALASGEEAAPADLADAQDTLQQLLDSWSNDGLLVHALTHETFTTLGQASYTIGTGGDLNTARPMAIVHARIMNGGYHEKPIQIVDANVWADLAIKNAATTFPDYLYYEPTYPLGKIYLSAPDIAGDNLKLITQKTLGSIPALTAEFSLPPGYERLIVLGLSIEVSPDYGRPVDPTVAALFQVAYSSMKRKNAASRGQTLKVDPALAGAARGTYDINEGP